VGWGRKGAEALAQVHTTGGQTPDHCPSTTPLSKSKPRPPYDSPDPVQLLLLLLGRRVLGHPLAPIHLPPLINPGLIIRPHPPRHLPAPYSRRHLLLGALLVGGARPLRRLQCGELAPLLAAEALLWQQLLGAVEEVEAAGLTEAECVAHPLGV